MAGLGRWIAALALGAGLAVASAASAEPATSPAPRPAFAPSIPDVSSDEALFDGAGVRVTSTGDPDEDATLSARRDAEDHGVLVIKDHESALLKVLADIPNPFVRQSVAGGELIYRANSMAGCVAFAESHPRPAPGGSNHFVCRGNPYPTAAFYLGSYYNEIGQPDRALTVLDLGLVAGPNSPLLISERNAALDALRRWDDTLAGAARGLAIPNLSPKDRALMLRNRGFALTELKRLDEAEQAYRDSLEFDSDNALAKNELKYLAGLKAGARATPGALLMPNRPKKN